MVRTGPRVVGALLSAVLVVAVFHAGWPNEARAAPVAPAVSPLQEFEEYLRYANGLAAAGEWGDAMRAYERARRIATQNRLPFDERAMEATIQAARKAAALPPPVRTELVPPPPPPLPRPPGKDVGPPFLPDQPGKIRPWTLPRNTASADMGVTAAEAKAMESNLRAIAAQVTSVPLLNPPRGFDLYMSATFGAVGTAAENKAARARGTALPADLFFSGPPYVQLRTRKKSTGEVKEGVGTMEGVDCGLRFHVNKPPFLGNSWEDKEGTFFLEPRKDGEIGGQPVYEDTLVIARPGDVLVKPVTTRRVLAHVLPQWEQSAAIATSGVEEKQKAYRAFMSAEAQEKRRREVAEIRASPSRGSEQAALQLETKQRRWEDDARKEAEKAATNPAHRQVLAALDEVRSRLERGDRQDLDAPACVILPTDRKSGDPWRVVSMGTPGCRPVVRHDPDLLDPRIPRTSIQILSIHRITFSTSTLETGKHLRENPGNCVAVSKLIRQIDWQKLAGTLARR